MYRWYTHPHAPSLLPPETHHPNRAYIFFVDIFRWCFSLMFSSTQHLHIRTYTHTCSLYHTHTHTLSLSRRLYFPFRLLLDTHIRTPHTHFLFHTHTLFLSRRHCFPFRLQAFCGAMLCASGGLPHIKRDLHIWKETYIYKRRPTSMKRDLDTRKETCIREKRHVCLKTYENRVIMHLWCYDVFQWRVTTHEKRDLRIRNRVVNVWSETRLESIMLCAS